MRLSWIKYMIACIVSYLLFYVFDAFQFPVSNDALWIGLCVLGCAFISHQEK